MIFTNPTRTSPHSGTHTLLPRSHVRVASGRNNMWHWRGFAHARVPLLLGTVGFGAQAWHSPQQLPVLQRALLHWLAQRCIVARLKQEAEG